MSRKAVPVRGACQPLVGRRKGQSPGTRLTEVKAILGIESAAGAEVDSAADDIACGESRTIRPTHVVRVVRVAIVAVIAIRVWFPTRRPR